MSKKIVSIILALMLLASTAVMATVSASAEDGVFYEPKPYVPSETAQEVGLVRFFFLLPNDWKNDWTDSAGIYWWSGTDPVGALDGSGSTESKWPGYKMYLFDPKEYTFYTDNDKENGEPLVTGTVWYVDLPCDVPTVVFSNALDGGDQSWDNFNQERYLKAYQTTDVQSEGIFPEDGFDGFVETDEEFETNNNMIYIINPELTSESVTGKQTFVGNWYLYHGDDKWDTPDNPIYNGSEGDEPGDPREGGAEQPTVPADGNDNNNQNTDNKGDKDPAGTTPDGSAPVPATGAGSNVSTPDQTQPTTVAGNGAIATGSVSLAIIALIIAAAITGVVIALRKREYER